MYKCTFIMKETVFFRTMVEFITNKNVKASPLIEWENGQFEGVELKLKSSIFANKGA